MMMLQAAFARTRLIGGWLVAIFACVIAPTGADVSTKQLQNMKGSVSYQVPNQTPQAIAPQAAIALADSDYAITGDTSLGGVTLPDSSSVLIGSQTKVQLAFFNQTNIANAKFIVYQGKTRFTVEHPKGTQANYTFSTPAAQIGVRGTQGDISVTPTSLQVNVYYVSDSKLPVVANFTDGRSYTINAGNTLVADLTTTPATIRVLPLSKTLQAPFSEFGDPTESAPHKRSWLLNSIINTLLNEAIDTATTPSQSSGSNSQPLPAATPPPATTTNTIPKGK